MSTPSTISSRPTIAPAAKFLASLTSLTVVAVGVIAIFKQEVPEIHTPLGRASALFSRDALIYGFTIICVGLTPLALFAKSGRAAGLWATACGLAALACLVGGLWLAK